jgi:hypothetical protein
MIEYQIHIDSGGGVKAIVAPPYEMVGALFESDIQADSAHCKELLAAIDDALLGRLDGWETTGNAYTLTLGKQTARIEELWEEPPSHCDVPLWDFREAVASLLDVLDGRKDHISRKE